MIQRDDLLGGTYRVIRQIGHGGTGLVFLAYHLNLRKYVVVKRVAMGTGRLEALRAETDVLKNLRHPNIPQVYDFLVREGEVFTVMDYIAGKSVDEMPAGTGRLSEKYLLQMLLQLSAVLSYLHRNRPAVIHSDIKPDNLIMTDDGKLCLIDFNIAVTTGVASSLSGYSMHFASPEQYRRILDIRARAGRITPLDARSDVYSTGAVFYYLITGCYPDTRQGRDSGAPQRPETFTGVQPAQVLYQDMRMRGYSDALCRVIARCLEPNRYLRWSDGHALYNAVRHLRRQDRMYQKYILLRAVSWLLSAALLGGGCWFLIKGKQREVLNAYREDLRTFTSSYERGSENAQSIGNDFLNKSDYKKIRKDNPDDSIMILSCLGDIAAEKEDYENAQQYYENALKTAQETDRDTSRMYRDYAVMLVRNGYLARAEEVMEQGGTDSADSLYVQAYIDLQKGDTEGCIQKTREIPGMGADAGLCADACVLAADACGQAGTTAASPEGSQEDRIAWLERAVLYSGEAGYQRLLGAEYWKQVGDTRRSEQQWASYAGKAAECYEKVCALPDARTDDVISRAAAMQYLGNYSETVSILEAARERNPEDYRIPAYLAIAYDASNDRAAASRAAAEALELSEQAGGVSIDNALLERVRAIR